MTLVFVLLAMTYRNRNERPGRYVVVLVLMCLALAYGLVIAGGLAVVWLWEIGNENWKKQEGQGNGKEDGRGKRESRDGQGDRGAAGLSIRKLLRVYAADRRIWWLAVLLAAAVCVIWMIMPRADTYATVSTTTETIKNPFAVRFLYTLFVLPSDAVLTDIYSDHIILSQAFLLPSALASGALIGMMIWGVLLYYGRKRRAVLLLVLPYGLFAAFSAAVYFSLHHIGIGLLYFCFWCWVSAESGDGAGSVMQLCPSGGRVKEPDPSGEKCGGYGTVMSDRETSAGVVRCAAILSGTLAMGVSLFWTGAACKLDIEKNYAPGRNEAAFIREHHLDRYRMMSGWLIAYDEEGNVRNTDINECSMAVNLSPYFEDNLYFNFNGGRNDRNYITHRRLSEEETREQYEIWRQAEPPQVLWMSPDLMTAYEGTVSMRDYVLVYQGDAEQVWKAGADYLASSIYVRRDLLDETGLSPLQTEQ